MDNVESVDKNVLMGALIAIIVCLVAFKGFAAPKVEKEPSQVQVPKPTAGTHATKDAPKPKASRSRNMSLDYEAGTHTTKDAPKAKPSRSRNMSLDYEAGTHKTEDVEEEPKPASSRTRKMSLDYEAGTHKADLSAVSQPEDEPAASVKPFGGDDKKVSDGKKNSGKAMDKQKNSVKEKQRKAQAITDEIARLTEQKLQMEIERERAAAAVVEAEVRRAEEIACSVGEDAAAWETVGQKSKKGKKVIGSANTAAGSLATPAAPRTAPAAAAKEVTISELVTAPSVAAAQAAVEGVSCSAAAAAAAVPAVPAVLQYVTVASKKLGQVIGPKGANLTALQDGYDVNVQVPKGEYAGTETTITVSGTSAENVKKVAKAVSDLAVKGYSGLLMSGNNVAAAVGGSDPHTNVFMERSMQIPTRVIPDIIGKNGTHIRTLQEKTGCKVTITNNTNVVNDVSFSRLSMAGTKSQIAQVKEVVKEIMQFHHSSLLVPEHIHRELDDALVPEDMYSVLIGTKGSEIKHIQGNFRVSLYIPHDDSQNRHVVLVGPEDCVSAAERYIYKQVAAVQARIAERNLRGFQDVDANTVLEREAREQEEELAREPWMQQYVRTADSEDITRNDLSAIVARKLIKK